MSLLHFRRLLSFSLLLFSATTASAAWERVVVDQALLEELFGEDAFVSDGPEQRPGFVDEQGVARMPGCSEGPQPIIDPNGSFVGPLPPSASPGEFAFFVERRAPEGVAPDLLLYLAGGGACWDGKTCIGSALTPGASYLTSINETTEGLDFLSADPLHTGAGGVFAERDDNPFAQFAKVYVPYCTGDVHAGSSDTTYSYQLPDQLGGLPMTWNVRHRGFDNLLVVLKWLQRERDASGGLFHRLTVSGSSAGGYGALLNFPVIRATLGESPEYSIIVDSSNGVLTNGFLDRAFGQPGNDGVWKARQNIAALLQPALDADAESLWYQVFDAVGRQYRDTRISQSTAAYDAVQAVVLWTMKGVDDGSYDPFVAPTEEEISRTAVLEWSPKARLSMLSTAFNLYNYRFYLGAGSGHIHLLDPPPELLGFPTTNYYLEDSARGTYYTVWLEEMLNNPRLFFRTEWRNLSCFPNCLQ